MSNATASRKWSRFGINLLVAVGSLIFFFAVSEGIFALSGVKPLALTEDPYFGFASGQPLFLKKKNAAGAEVYETNPVKLTHFNFQSFPAKKAPGTFRIFTLGGSTTYGHPWRDSTSFTGWLRELLADQDSTRHYEVINAGGISYASYRAARLAEELAGYQPDLFVVYNGHNEFLEERTYRAALEIPGWVRNLSSLLDHTRTYSTMRRLAGARKPLAGQTLAAEVDDVLARTIGPSSYKRDDALKARVLEHYEESQKRIGLLARSAGAQVIYITTPSNEKDCSPFKSEATPGLAVDQALRSAALLRAGEALLAFRPAEASEKFDSAAALDPRNAATRYAAGRAALVAGRADAAKAQFRRAIDEDICPLRALTPMHAIELRVARATGGGFVDFEDSLRASVRVRQGYDALGDPDFTDHVHLTVAHYGDIARGVVAEMIRMKLLPAVDSAISARVRALAARRVYARLTPAEEGLGYHNIAKVLNWAGKTEEATRAAMHGLEKDTVSLESIWSSLFVGAELERHGDSRKALPYYRRALRLDSTNSECWRLLGEALVRLGDTTQGEILIEEAIVRDPADLHLREQAGRLAYARRKYEAAVYHLRVVSARNPENTSPRVLLAGSLIALGRPTEAEVELRDILRVNPNEAGAWFGMGFISESRGDIQSAIQNYAQAVRLDPGEVMAQNALARLMGGGR